jgi:BMFP domain-containing protein YqiC
MKLALASSVGAADETLEAHVDFHLGAGVDTIFIGASQADVPERLARRADVHVVERADELLPAVAAEGGADWVIESDANEFWWPRGGTLKELLELVAAAYGSVQALPRQFVPVAPKAEPFSERMIHRLAHGRSERRYVRRAGRGDGRLDPVRGWFPIEVLCFPVSDEPGGVYDEDALRRGVEEGVLSLDTRVRDALRALAEGRSPEFGRTDLVEEARFAADLATLGEADIAHARERMDELEARLSALESSFTEIVKRKLRALKRPS